MSAVDKHDFSNLPREESSLDVDNLIVHGRWKVHKEWADVVGSYNKRPAIVFCFTQSDKKAEWMARNERRERRVLIDVKHEFTYRDYECIVGELASFSSTQS
ncbi:hypothetical protein BDF22DRAFT_653805 [Syncephalis plumigaleata]|nr:hypothetical protein BDF22DRAFT_653805 [Syncephalis plumigaleata]